MHFYRKQRGNQTKHPNNKKRVLHANMETLSYP